MFLRYLKSIHLITLCIKCVGSNFLHKLYSTIYDKINLYYWKSNKNIYTLYESRKCHFLNFSLKKCKLFLKNLKNYSLSKNVKKVIKCSTGLPFSPRKDKWYLWKTKSIIFYYLLFAFLHFYYIFSLF